MAANVVRSPIDKYFSALSRQTLNLFDEMQDHIQQLGPKYDKFKIDFIKRVSYQ